MGPVLSAAGLLAAVLLVLAGAYAFTRWAGKSLGGGFPGLLSAAGRIEILDRASVARDQALLVVRAGERYFLLSSGPGGLTLLTELTQEEGERWKLPASRAGSGGAPFPDFRAILRRARKKR